MHNIAQVKTILARFRYDPWNMMGPRNKAIRQALILAITGEKRPLAKCGVTAIEQLLQERIDTSAATCAARYPDFYKARLESAIPNPSIIPFHTQAEGRLSRHQQPRAIHLLPINFL